MTIIEAPDDAAYQFSHPAGGPTTIGPRWRESLGKLSYMRTGRIIFFPEGNYVTLAKRYRKYAIDTGLFVPLAEKIARRPIVKQMIGTPFSRIGALTNIKSDSLRYSTTEPSFNHHVTTFDQIAERLKNLKSSGIDHFMLVLTSWPKEGYDRQHPDVLPPAPEAGGGYERHGTSSCAKPVKTSDTSSLSTTNTATTTPTPPAIAVISPSTKKTKIPSPANSPAHDSANGKKGSLAFMNNWDFGGEMAYLNPRLMLGHVQKKLRLASSPTTSTLTAAIKTSSAMSPPIKTSTPNIPPQEPTAA